MLRDRMRGTERFRRCERRTSNLKKHLKYQCSNCNMYNILFCLKELFFFNCCFERLKEKIVL